MIQLASSTGGTPSTYATAVVGNIPTRSGSMWVSTASATRTLTAAAIASRLVLTGRRARSRIAAAVAPMATPISAPLTTRKLRWYPRVALKRRVWANWKSSPAAETRNIPQSPPRRGIRGTLPMLALSGLSGGEQCATSSAVPGTPNAKSADPVEVAPVPRNQIEVVFQSSRRNKSVGHADVRRTPDAARALGDRRIDREL